MSDESNLKAKISPVSNGIRTFNEPSMVSTNHFTYFSAMRVGCSEATIIR